MCKQCDQGLTITSKHCPFCNGSCETRDGHTCNHCKDGEVDTIVYCSCDLGIEKECNDHYDLDTEWYMYCEYVHNMPEDQKVKGNMISGKSCFFSWVLEFGERH